jgi:hypothetical protein
LEFLLSETLVLTNESYSIKEVSHSLTAQYIRNVRQRANQRICAPLPVGRCGEEIRSRISAEAFNLPSGIPRTETASQRRVSAAIRSGFNCQSGQWRHCGL